MPGAAVFLLDGDAEDAERAHLAPQIRREFVDAVDLGGARRDLVRGEAPTDSRSVSALSPRPKSNAGS